MRRSGYHSLLGQDIDDSCRRRLVRNGVRFCHGLLEDCHLPERSFDVIRMEHVLEHVPDPAQALSLVRRFLKTDGLLVIGVPNIKSLSFSLTGLRWHALELPRYLLNSAG